MRFSVLFRIHRYRQNDVLISYDQLAPILNCLIELRRLQLAVPKISFRSIPLSLVGVTTTFNFKLKSILRNITAQL